MSERRRRGSTSSVETVDNSQVRWVQESSVVRTLPSDSDSDDWPCFELQDAVVYDREGKAFDNPLYVSTRGPFTVRGRLIITDPSQKAYLIARVKASTPIEIRNCTRYSIGLEGDEDVERPNIWVAGRGGWYEIQPAEEYLPFYLKMCEATTMYYSMVDAWTSEKFRRPLKKSNKSGRLEKLQSVFLEYATKVGDGSTFDEVVERCREHAPFFINHFREESTETIDWTNTEFYSWFLHEFADVAQEIDKLTANPDTNYQPPPASSIPRDRSSRLTTRSASIDDSPRNQGSAVRIPERPKSIPHKVESNPDIDQDGPVTPAQTTTAVAPINDVPESDDSAFASVFSALEHIYDLYLSGKFKKGLAVTTIVNSLYFDYKCPNYKDGTPGSHRVPIKEVLHYHAKELLQHLDRAKYERHEIYGYLKELADQEFSCVAWKQSDFPLRLIPRKPMPRVSMKTDGLAPAFASGPVEASENGFHEDVGMLRPMGKSIRHPGQRSRKSGLRTISSKKRSHAELQGDSESDSEVSAAKKSHYFSDGPCDGDVDMMGFAPQDMGPETPETQPSNLEADEEEDEADAIEEPVPLIIRVERIPLTRPTGPDGTWTCDQSGCDYVVRGGDDEECQARIRRHFEEHEQQAKRLNLAVTESSRGHVPVKYANGPPKPNPPPPPSSSRPPAEPAAPSSSPSPCIHETHCTPIPISSSTPPSSPADDPQNNNPITIPDLSGSARESFRRLVEQFHRRPHPVSDRIASLTCLQSFTREAQKDEREERQQQRQQGSRYVPAVGRGRAASDQTETDSLTIE